MTKPQKIKDFPIINKQDLKKVLSATNYYENISFKHKFKTSGTTGSVSLIIPTSSDFIKYKFASIEYFLDKFIEIGLNIRTAFVEIVFCR